jgi:hypothetical protein
MANPFDDREFLMTCLKAALPLSDASLIRDVAGAAVLSGITARVIALDVISPSALATSLFLTNDEAAAVTMTCKAMIGSAENPADGGCDTRTHVCMHMGKCGCLLRFRGA